MNYLLNHFVWPANQQNNKQIETRQKPKQPTIKEENKLKNKTEFLDNSNKTKEYWYILP